MSSINPDLPRRFKTAVILISIVLISAIYASFSVWGSRLFALIGILAVLISAYEYLVVRTKICLLSKWENLGSLSLIVFPSIFTYFFAAFSPASCDLMTLAFYSLLCSLFFMTVLIWNFSVSFKSSAEISVFTRLFVCDLLAYILLGLGASCLILLALKLPLYVLFLIFLVATADTSAYFVGRKFGILKIAKMVSPSKTVVGTVASLFITAFISLLFSQVFTSIDYLQAFICGFLIALSSQSGDFAKSIVKRTFGTKDFSDILPGHGGVFDRIDGLLGAAPVYLMLVILCNQ